MTVLTISHRKPNLIVIYLFTGFGFKNELYIVRKNVSGTLPISLWRIGQSAPVKKETLNNNRVWLAICYCEMGRVSPTLLRTVCLEQFCLRLKSEYLLRTEFSKKRIFWMFGMFLHFKPPHVAPWYDDHDHFDNDFLITTIYRYNILSRKAMRIE